jgi:hypothetical protein
MVSAYWEQPLLQEDVARWLGTRGVGTPSSRVERVRSYGFTVFYGTGSLAVVEANLAHGYPTILFVRTGELRPHWQIDTPHAVVVAGVEGDNAVLFDPGLPVAPIVVSTGNLMLAWSYFDYGYALITVQR